MFVEEVSLVDRPANKRKFLLNKSEAMDKAIKAIEVAQSAIVQLPAVIEKTGASGDPAALVELFKSTTVDLAQVVGLPNPFMVQAAAPTKDDEEEEETKKAAPAKDEDEDDKAKQKAAPPEEEEEEKAKKKTKSVDPLMDKLNEMSTALGKVTQTISTLAQTVGKQELAAAATQARLTQVEKGLVPPNSTPAEARVPLAEKKVAWPQDMNAAPLPRS